MRWPSRVFLSGQAVSLLGDGLAVLAIPLLVLQLTHSPLISGLSAASMTLGYLVVGLPAGVLVDRLDAWRALVTMDAARTAAFAARASQPGRLTGPDAEAAVCDTTLVPIVTGHVDQDALDRLTEFYLTTHDLRLEDAESQGEPPGSGLLGGGSTGGSGGHVSRAGEGCAGSGDGETSQDSAGCETGQDSADGHGARSGSAGGLPGRGVLSASRQSSGRPCSVGHTGTGRPDGCGCTCGNCTCPARRPLSPDTVRLGPPPSLPAGRVYYSRRMATPRRYQSHDEDSARWIGFPYRDDDIVISTRSKTGTTWVQMICALLIFQQPRLPAPIAQLSPWLDHLIAPREEVFAQLAAQQHRRFIKTHTPLDGIPLDPRVTYLVTARHPLDMAVSLYHHSGNIDRARLRQLTGQPEPATPPPPLPPLHDWLLDWIADDHDPAERLDSLPGLMWHLSDAWARRDQPNILLVHYDKLSADLAGQMRWLAGRLGITVPEHAWPELVRAATFESMSGDADTTVPTAGLFKNNAAFFRRGTSGAGREILSDRELAAYHDRAADLAPADMLAWLHSPGAGETPDRSGV